MEKIKKIHEKELDMLLEVERIAKKYNITYFLAYGSALGAIRHYGFIPWDEDVDIVIKINEYDRFCEAINKEINREFVIEHIMFDSNYDSLKARISVKGSSNLVTHIDVFPLVGLPDSNLGKKIFTSVAYLNYRLHFLKRLNPDLNYKNKPLKRKSAKILKKLTAFIQISITIKINDKLQKAFPLDKSKYIYNLCGSYGKKEIIPSFWFNQAVEKEFEGYYLPVPIEYDNYLSRIYGNYMEPKKNNYV